MSNNVKIFIAYHKPYQLLQSDILTPLHVGRSIAHVPSKDHPPIGEKDLQWMKSNMAGDNTGENISDRNRNYCELTGIYWAWKNYETIGNPDYIGFMQYRRHFIFNENVYNTYIPHNNNEKAYLKYSVGAMYDGYSDFFGLTDDTIKRVCADYDCIIPKKCELKHVGISSIYEDYRNIIAGTKAKDFRLLVNTVKKKAPDYYATIKQRARMSDKNCFQSFVFTKALFFEYCAFLFGILNEIDKKLDTSGYSVNGQRTLGYLGELLFDCYTHKLRNNDQIRYKELGMTYICTDSIPVSIKNKTAIILLACADYESFEISLALYSKFLAGDTKLFILQNGRGTYDCERTYRAAQRYENLFPRNIKVIDYIPPAMPYFAIRKLINSKELDGFDYICKVDEDAFPITPDWLDKLCECYEYHYARYGDNVAYATPLINNNPFGFTKILENNKTLRDEYFSKIAIDHKVGVDYSGDSYPPARIIPKTEVYGGLHGTIWRYAHITRWLHEKTTLIPDTYIKMTMDLPDTIFQDDRYSINCILFKKTYWNDIVRAVPGNGDDEHLSFVFCKENNKKIVVCQSIPFVHLFFSTQREENRDMIPDIRKLYQQRLDIPFPIAMCPVKENEIENRLRFLEYKMKGANRPHFSKQNYFFMNPAVIQKMLKIINMFFPRKGKIYYKLRKTYYRLGGVTKNSSF